MCPAVHVVCRSAACAQPGRLGRAWCEVIEVTLFFLFSLPCIMVDEGRSALRLCEKRATTRTCGCCAWCLLASTCSSGLPQVGSSAICPCQPTPPWITLYPVVRADWPDIAARRVPQSQADLCDLGHQLLPPAHYHVRTQPAGRLSRNADRHPAEGLSRWMRDSRLQPLHCHGLCLAPFWFGFCDPRGKKPRKN